MPRRFFPHFPLALRPSGPYHGGGAEERPRHVHAFTVSKRLRTLLLDLGISTPEVPPYFEEVIICLVIVPLPVRPGQPIS